MTAKSHMTPRSAVTLYSVRPGCDMFVRQILASSRISLRLAAIQPDTDEDRGPDRRVDERRQDVPARQRLGRGEQEHHEDPVSRLSDARATRSPSHRRLSLRMSSNPSAKNVGSRYENGA